MGKDPRGLEGATTFLLLLFILPGASAAPEAEPQILVLVPFLIHTETQEKVFVQLSNLNESVTLTVTLEYPTENKTLIHEVVSEDRFTTIPFKLPKLATSSSMLELVVRVHAKGKTLNFWFVKRMLVRDIEHMVIIQTDKPIYKPSQIVQFRIAALDENFRPVNEQFPLVYIEDPQRNRLFQWTDVKLDAGLTQLNFPLSSEPPLGTFSVVVQRRSKDKVRHGFAVNEYVLPTFEVVVSAPKRISLLAQAMEVKACGKYTYGKPVPGWVEVHVCRKYTYSSRGQCYGKDSEGICETFSGQTDGRGCVSQVVKTSLFQLKRSGYMMEIETEATVREEGTNVTLRGKGTTEITRVLSKLTFEKADPYIKPGVPFSGQVKLVDGDDLPIANQTVTISASELEYKVNYTTDQEGVVLFSVDTTNATESSVTFQATYKTFSGCNDWNWVEPEHRFAFHSAAWFYSPSRSYISVKSVPGVLKCGHSQQVQVHYILNLGLAKEQKIVFHYLVMAKGGIVRTGSHVLQGVHGEVKGVFSLDLAVDPDIAPQARLLLYTILPSGELVADSARFDIENCFANKVKLWFTEPEGLPGSDTQLHISSAKGSLCAITAVDESIFLLKPEAELSARHVYNLLPLRNLQGYHYGGYSVEEGRPPCRKEKGILVNGIRYYPESFRDNEGDPYQILRDLGLKVFTSTEIYKPEICRHVPAPIPVAYYSSSEFPTARLSSEAHISEVRGGSLPPPRLEGSTALSTIRKYLPETWLFKLIVVNAETQEEKVPVTIPDTITEWRAGAFCLSPDVGFGLAPWTTFRGFQPFFIDSSLPYSVIRGEGFQMKATVFTYLQKCIRVKITLDPSPDFEATPVKQEESYCLCENERKTVSWDVTPKSLGKVNFTVSAEALNLGQLCGNEIVAVPSKGRKDTLIKSLLVEPEGIEKQEVFNTFLCAGEENVAPISLKLPENVVKDSARASFCVQGDILSSAIQNLHQLIQLPYGCGEQNMARFAPNIYVLDYLNNTGQLTPEIKSKAIGYLETGYQQQLKYRHNDGSYSTFGERKWETGNTWLTAFVLKSFAQARKYIYIDPEHIRTAQMALAVQQKENGCFQSTGTLLNNALQGGVNDEISLSAYIIISILEAGLSPSNILARNGLFCLETASESKNIDVYSRALMAYAFTLAGKEGKRQEMLRVLNELAVKEDDGSIHWEQPRKEEENAAHVVVNVRSPAADVEITSYVLLSWIYKPERPLQLSQLERSPTEELTLGPRIVRWLARQQTSNGGFASTKDTVIALEALSAFAGETYSVDISGTDVTLNSNPRALGQFRVDSTNRLLLQCVTLPKVPGEYSSRATGDACVYAQTTLKYNVLPQEGDAPFDLRVQTIPETCASPKAQKTFDLAMNFSYGGSRSVSNMAIVDIKLLSGFIPVKSSVKKLESKDNVKRTEVSASHVLLYLQKVTNETESFSFTVEQETPVEDLKPAVVKIYDYYEPEEYAVVMYNAPCSTAAGGKTKSA